MDAQSDFDIMRRHIAKLEHTFPYKLNAMIIYTYNNGNARKGYYSPTGMNLGDYVQSIAARQFLPRVDAYVDRDRLAYYNGERINMIMNAWYCLWKGNEVFSNRIRPLLTSIHLANTHEIHDRTLDYFKKNEPIGCRDFATREFFRANGISSYFSGCLTLTLGETFRRIDRGNIVYFVDYKIDECGNKEIDKEILKIIKIYKPCEIQYLSHNLHCITLNVNESLMRATKLLEKYAQARLVVTQNLHCALPCLAMGVPVVFVVPRYDHARYGGLISLLNSIGENEAGEFSTRIKYSDSGIVYNDDAFKHYSKMLKQLCHAFMKSDTKQLYSNTSDSLKVFDDGGDTFLRNLDITRRVRNFFIKTSKNKSEVRILKIFKYKSNNNNADGSD